MQESLPAESLQQDTLYLWVLAMCGLQQFPRDGLLSPRTGEPERGLRTLTPLGEPLQYNYSPVCRSPIWRVWDLIISWKYACYYLVVASSLSLNVEYLFGRLQFFLSVVVQQLVVILVFSWEDMRLSPTTLLSCLLRDKAFLMAWDIPAPLPAMPGWVELIMG